MCAAGSLSSAKSDVLAISFRSGVIYLMNNCFDVAPRRINTRLSGGHSLLVYCFKAVKSGRRSTKSALHSECLKWFVGLSGTVSVMSVPYLMPDVRMEWASSMFLLAVGGSVGTCQNMFVNTVHFYTPAGLLLSRMHLPDTVSLLKLRIRMQTTTLWAIVNECILELLNSVNCSSS